MLNGIVIPDRFRGHHVMDVDFSKLKNCYFVIVEAPLFAGNDERVALIVDRCDKAGLPCFVTYPFNAFDVYREIINGYQTYRDHWFEMIRNKTLQVGFFHLTNVTMDTGSNLPPKSLTKVLNYFLDEVRLATSNVPPEMLDRTNLMLMTDADTIRKYETTLDVSTQLAREEWIALSDTYRTIDDVIRLLDLSSLDQIYDSLEFIGLDGKPHDNQDKLHAQNRFVHVWARDFIQTPAVRLSNGGEGVVGAAKCFLTLAQLQNWTRMTINVNTGDSTPDSEEPQKPDTTPAIGCDVSHWQDDNTTPEQIDFHKMKEAGATFVYIKASQDQFTDSDFVWNWAQAKEAGLLRGAYHFADYRKSAIEQSKYFYRLLEADPGELPPVLDYELVSSWGGTPSPTANTNWIKKFFDAWPLTPPINFYCNPYFIRDNLIHPLPDWLIAHDLWIANYTEADEPETFDWPDWTFWQFTDRGDGLYFGVESKQIDMNYFYGTVPELLEYSEETMGIEQPEPPEPPQPPTELNLCEKVDRLWNAHPDLWEL